MRERERERECEGVCSEKRLHTVQSVVLDLFSILKSSDNCLILHSTTSVLFHSGTLRTISTTTFTDIVFVLPLYIILPSARKVKYSSIMFGSRTASLWPWIACNSALRSGHEGSQDAVDKRLIPAGSWFSREHFD